MPRRIDLSLPRPLIRAIDKVRKQEPRSQFVTRLLLNSRELRAAALLRGIDLSEVKPNKLGRPPLAEIEDRQD